jgi:hypothetical protein
MKFQHPHLDAAENMTFERKLEFVKARVYEARYAQFKARTLIPVSFEADPATETIVYHEYDGVGVAKLLASYSDDLPRADVKAKEVRSPVKGIGSSYGYGLQEVRASAKSGANLEMRKAAMARRAIEQTINSIGLKGNATMGLIGLLNITNALSYTVPNGAGGVATWVAGAGKTPTEILKDMHGIAKYVFEQTKGVESPDTMLLPASQYGYIATTRIDATSEVTILKYFLANDPYIKAVEPLFEAAGAGAASKDRMVVYRRDPEHLTLEIPQDFEQLAPEQDGLETVIACHARCGGVICPLPLSVAYGDGI